MIAVSNIECPACGLAVPVGTAICPQDGTPLVPEAPAPAPASRPRASGPRAARPDSGNRREIPVRDEGTDRGPPPGSPQGEAGQADRSVLRDPLIGAMLGEYKVQERVGLGGMGLVYRGVHPVIGKSVAIKVLRPEICDSAAHVERLIAEARAVNAIRHRGIVDIFSFGKTADGRQYLVMEFLDGIALDAHIAERGMMVPTEAVNVLEEVCAALAAAHGAGVIHRDLKPNNIFLVKPPYGARYTKILDFGLAKQGLPPGGTTPQTHFGLVVGTPEYMAPEQARGENVGPKTDLYSLGVMAFQMLTGQLPFDAKSPMEFVVKHLEHAPPEVIDVQPDVPKEVSDLVARLLAKPPEDRPESAEVVRRELRRIAKALPQESTQSGYPLPSAVPPPSPRPSGPRPSASGPKRPPEPPPPPPPEAREEAAAQEPTQPQAMPAPPPDEAVAQEPTQRRPMPTPHAPLTQRVMTSRARNLLVLGMAGSVLLVSAGSAALLRFRSQDPRPAPAPPPIVTAAVSQPEPKPEPEPEAAGEVPDIPAPVPVAPPRPPPAPADSIQPEPLPQVEPKQPKPRSPLSPPLPEKEAPRAISAQSLIKRADALQARYDVLPNKSVIAPLLLNKVRQEAPSASDQRLKELSTMLSKWELEYLGTSETR